MARNFLPTYEPVKYRDEVDLTPKHMCFICRRVRKNFFCVNCVKCGSMYHSSLKDCERFADKKLKIFGANQEEQNILKEFEKCINQRVLYQQKYFEQTELKQRIEHLKQAKVAVESQNLKYEADIRNLEATIQELHENRFNSHIQTIRMLQSALKDYRHKSSEWQSLMESEKKVMGNVVRICARNLSNDIFPIERIILDDGASRFAFFFSIVSKVCIIPADGNYKNTNLPAPEQYQQTIADTSGKPCTARHTNTAFSLFCQLVQLLSLFLQVPLPKHISFSEFCHQDIIKDHLSHYVAKLNVNIVHLCHSQGVVVKDPTLTGQNLKSLLDSPQLGRLEPFTVPDEAFAPLEEDLLQEEPYVNEPLEEEVDHGWDVCSHREALLLADTTPSPTPSVAQSSQASVQPTLMTSAIESFWKMLGQR